MSEKTRRKKEGQDTNKKNQRMREAVQERHKGAVPVVSTAEGDIQRFKPGAADDRTRQNLQHSAEER